MKKAYLSVLLLAIFFQGFCQLTNGLVSYWKLDETSGNILDAAGSNSGTVYGAVPNQTGKIGKSYSFDGTNDYVNVPNSSSLNIQGNTITLSAWLYPVSNKHSVIVSKLHNVGTHVPPYFQYTLQFFYTSDPSPRIYPRFAVSVGGAFKFTANTSITVSLNQWHHLVGVYNGSTLKLYLDGEEVSSTAQSGNIDGYNTPVYISEIGSLSGAEVFNGRIDEIGIWNRALSVSEVSQLFNSGNGLAYPFESVVHVSSVTITPSPATVALGGTVQLTANVLPENATNKTVTWTNMGNPALFSVSSTGLVTALGPVGSTGTIGAIAKDNGISGTTTVEIVSVEVPVTSVSVTPATATINEGSTVQLTANISPSNATNKNVTWSSNNTSVATVNSSGVVTGKTSGTAAITVKTNDGNKTATCTITVSELPTAKWNQSGTHAYYINGNIGIGTDKNLANNRLTVNGKILAKEVEVVSSIASDFVFQPEYELMPLTELELYLKKNKHLPDIPSVNEFREKGQNLGEMQDLLLRKIEELSLYIISQNKKIEILQNEINEIKAFHNN